MDLLPLIPTGASRVPGNSGPHLGLIRTYRLWSLPGHHWDLDTLLYTWASPGHGDCGPTWASPEGGDWFPQGHHLDLVTQVLIWAAFTWILSSTSGLHLFLVILVPLWGSPRSGDSGSQFGLTWTWCLSSPF